MMAKVKVLRLLLLPLLALLAFTEAVQAQEELILNILAESQNIIINQSTGILVMVITRAGDPVVGQEITFTTDLGTVEPAHAVSDANGDVWVTFVASSLIGVSHITASAGGVSEMIEVTIGLSTFQWNILVFLSLFILFGVAVLFQRRATKIRQKEE